MKATIKVLGAIFSLGLVMAVIFHLVMLYGLTKAMRDVVLPRVKQETGVDVRVGKLSINVANGLLFLRDIEVRNPEGFLLENMASVERVEVEVDLLSLLSKKPIQIKSIEVENALVNVIRNQAGEINISTMQAGLPEPPAPSTGQEQVPDRVKPSPEKAPRGDGVEPTQKAEPFPEMLIEALACNATIRYVDFKLNQLDIALNLNVTGRGLSTQLNPTTPWGQVNVFGSLGDDRTSFVTDLRLNLAPITDTENLSFDLTGKIMEIDPRIVESVYRRMGIRSAPFGIDPEFHCRNNRFENSKITLTLRDIELEDKLSDRLGGMGNISSLRFSLPVEGTLEKPIVDLESGFKNAIGGNVGSLFGAFLMGAAGKEAGTDVPPETMQDAAVEVLGAHVDEIGESETVKRVLKDLADGEPSATNAPDPISTDTLVDLLGEQVDEIGENEELKDELKNLGKWLFGN